MHEAERNDRTLRRIIATLVALAVLAERAAYRSLPVRWLVLCLLRHAEAVTRDHVAETTGWDLSDLELAFGIDAPDAGFDPGQGAGNGLADGHIFTGSGSGPADALALAWRLRALAAVLGSLLSSTRHPNDWTIDLDGWTAVPEATPRGLAPRADSLFVILNGRRHAFQDTS